MLSADEDLAVPCRVTANRSMRIPGRVQRHSFISVTMTFVKFWFGFPLISMFSSFFWFLFPFSPLAPQLPALPSIVALCRLPRFLICFKPKALLSINLCIYKHYRPLYMCMPLCEQPSHPAPTRPLTSSVPPTLPQLTLTYSPPFPLLSSFLFFLFSSVLLGFPPLFLPPLLIGAGRCWGCFLSRCPGGRFFPFELSLPDDFGFLGFLSSPPPNPSLFLCFFVDYYYYFLCVLHAEVCMTHVVEGERLRKVQGSICVACLNAMCVDIVHQAPAQRAPLKTTFSFFLLFSPPPVPPLSVSLPPARGRPRRPLLHGLVAGRIRRPLAPGAAVMVPARPLWSEPSTAIGIAPAPPRRPDTAVRHPACRPQRGSAPLATAATRKARCAPTRSALTEPTVPTLRSKCSPGATASEAWVSGVSCCYPGVRCAPRLEWGGHWVGVLLESDSSRDG